MYLSDLAVYKVQEPWTPTRSQNASDPSGSQSCSETRCATYGCPINHNQCKDQDHSASSYPAYDAFQPLPKIWQSKAVAKFQVFSYNFNPRSPSGHRTIDLPLPQAFVIDLQRQPRMRSIKVYAVLFSLVEYAYLYGSLAKAIHERQSKSMTFP